MPNSSKRLRWETSVEEKCVLHINDYNVKDAGASFLVAEDYERIAKDNRLIFDLIDSDLFVETRLRSRRGLAKCQGRRPKVVEAIFTEQKKQKKSQVFDLEALAKASRRESHDSRTEAYVTGVSDSNVARMLEALELKEISSKKKTPTTSANESRYRILLEQRESFRDQRKQKQAYPPVA
jgi:hypothetical protein